MASSANLTSFFLLSLLFIQIHGRESNFFSKIPNSDPKETQIPNKIDPFPKEETHHEQEPNFIPQSQENGYGLYGHESGQLPPSDIKSDIKSDIPYKSEDQFYSNNGDFENLYPNPKPYANSVYYNKDLYETRPQRFENSRLSRDDFTSTPLYNQQKTEKNSYFNGGARNVGPQGLSDTRSLENGKYYYDVGREPRHYRNPSFSNEKRGYFGNSGDKYEYSNSMGGFQNDESEFQEELPEEFGP